MYLIIKLIKKVKKKLKQDLLLNTINFQLALCDQVYLQHIGDDSIDDASVISDVIIPLIANIRLDPNNQKVLRRTREKMVANRSIAEKCLYFEKTCTFTVEVSYFSIHLVLCLNITLTFVYTYTSSFYLIYDLLQFKICVYIYNFVQLL